MIPLPRALALAVLLPLSGCVFAIGNTPDEGGPVGKRLSAIEKRLGALEEKCGACEGAPCISLGMMNDGGGMKVMKTGEVKVMRMAGPMGNAKVECKDGTLLFTGPDGKPIVIDLEKATKDGMVVVETEREDDEKGEMEEREKGEAGEHEKK